MQSTEETNVQIPILVMSLYFKCVCNSLWHLFEKTDSEYIISDFIFFSFLEIFLLYYMAAVKFVMISIISSYFQRALTRNFQGVKISSAEILT